jgi:minor histocompatibility antigen H13
MLTKNWIYNNVLAIGMCVNAIQMIFLGNFTNGFLLLVFLFFYDIFFVFGTDVMLTVAKSIDAPIKLLFPTNWEATNEETGLVEPTYSLLGLGDIVIPGIFIALCLRYDIIKTLNAATVNKLMEKGDPSEVSKLIRKAAATSSQHYFFGCLIGYLFAIIATIAVMLIFEHGQPALLYLVPGCLLSVIINALMKGEWAGLWEFDEEKFTQDKKAQEIEKAAKAAGNKRK